MHAKCRQSPTFYEVLLDRKIFFPDGWMNEYISLDRTDAILCCRRETGTTEKRTQAQGIFIILFTTVLVCLCHQWSECVGVIFLAVVQLGRNVIQCVRSLQNMIKDVCYHRI